MIPIDLKSECIWLFLSVLTLWMDWWHVMVVLCLWLDGSWDKLQSPHPGKMAWIWKMNECYATNLINNIITVHTCTLTVLWKLMDYSDLSSCMTLLLYLRLIKLRGG